MQMIDRQHLNLLEPQKIQIKKWARQGLFIYLFILGGGG